MDGALMRDEWGIDFGSRVRATLPGFRLVFNMPGREAEGAANANIIGDPKDTVQGALYEISNADLVQLDKCIGVEESDYTRVVLLVSSDDERTIEAVTYVGSPAAYRDDVRPTKEYVTHMLNGADVLDAEYLAKLKAVVPTDS
jgi:hypothetical protein